MKVNAASVHREKVHHWLLSRLHPDLLAEAEEEVGKLDGDPNATATLPAAKPAGHGSRKRPATKSGEHRMASALLNVLILVGVLLLMMGCLSGCAATRQEATIERERTVGVQGGQAVDLTRTREQQTQEQKRATVDTEEIARVTADTTGKVLKAGLEAALPGLSAALAAAVPKADLAPVLGGLGDAAKMMADLRATMAQAKEAQDRFHDAQAAIGRGVEDLKAQTAPKPANPLDPTGPAGGGVLAIAGLAAAEWQRRGKRKAEDRAATHARHLDETVSGIEAAKGVIAPVEWVKVRNALMTRQSSDTQAHIDSKTP